MKVFVKLALAGLLTSFGSAQEAVDPTPPEAKKVETTEAVKEAPKPAEEVIVIMSTSLGDIHIQLDAKNAPITVKNFLMYADDKFYDGTIFHRVIDGFMIQGGGFKEEGETLKKLTTKPAIKNESEKTPPNHRGTIAMARTPHPDSATSQFFINVRDNAALNYPHNGGGYATFGKVTKGMEIVDKIKATKTTFKNNMGDVPAQTITIKSVTRAK